MPDYSYDVFVSHSDADLLWVQDDLLPRLEAANLKVFVPSRDLEAGTVMIDALPEAMVRSRKVLLILSPSYVASMWGGFESALIQHEDPINELRRFLPILKDVCQVPARLRIFHPLDLVNPDTMSDPWDKLYEAIQAQTPSISEILGDQIPLPTTLPPRSRMPFAPNPQFVGREDELRKLAQVLQPGTTAAIGQVGEKLLAASGLGGIGKTQLASEFVHRYGQFYYGGVHWLSFADPASVPAEIAECALALNPKLADRPLEEQLQVVKAAWEGKTPRLLVFDNCEDEALLEQYRPKTGKCSILVTSRRGNWDEYLGVQTVSLGVLSKEESITLLRSYKPASNVSDSDLEALADELGHLPLALHLAGSFLHEYKDDMTVEEYLAELRAAEQLDIDLLEREGISATGHDQSVYRTFRLSYDRLKPTDATDTLALKLLARVSFFAPGELLPWELLKATLGFVEDDKKAARQATKALRRLVNLSLIEQEGEGNLRAHRLVASFARSVSEDQEAQEAVETTMLDVASEFNRKGVPAPLLALQPHLRAITTHARHRNDLHTAYLCNNLAYHLDMIGDYSAARLLYEQALHIRQAILGPDHLETATTLNNLAVLFTTIGNYSAARPLHEQALRIRQTTLGPDHPDTAGSLNNIADMLLNQGNCAAARPLYEQALHIRQAALGPDHPDTAGSLNNLAGVLCKMGNYIEARPLYEQALRIRQTALGPDHPDTATPLSNLASLLEHMGNYIEARPLYEQALRIRQTALGPDHPLTAQTMGNLAGLHYATHDYMAAQALYEQALHIMEKIFGPNHSNTAISLNNLAALHYATHDYGAAQILYERSLRITKEVFGSNHPQTAVSLNNLAALHEKMGNYQLAQSLYEQALQIYHGQFGPNHPTTLIIASNLRAIKKHSW